MSSLKSQIESILFIIGKPISFKQLAKLCGRTKSEIEVVMEDLKNKYKSKESGIRLISTNKEVQMVTSDENAELIEGLLKEEVTNELTQPQLETLTIIVYRGPITKLELEQIRGVNCSLILRNLTIKGLVEVIEDKIIDNNRYKVTIKLMQHLGINNIEELPEYDKLSKVETLDEILNQDIN